MEVEMRALGAMTLLMAMTACSDNAPVFKGTAMDGYFPFDGSERTWLMANTEVEVKHQLMGTMIRPDVPETYEGNDVHTIQWDRVCAPGVLDCEEGWEYSLKWAVDSVEGIMIVGVDTVETGPVLWDSPLVVADAYMIRGESVTSEADGETWTSTYAAVEPCPIEYVDTWECARMVMSTASGSHWLEGVFHHVPSFNFASMEFTNGVGRWSLIDVSYTQ
jgi:hypothetical protein